MVNPVHVFTAMPAAPMEDILDTDQFDSSIQLFSKEQLDLWSKQPVTLADHAVRYTPGEQSSHEAECDELLDALSTEGRLRSLRSLSRGIDRHVRARFLLMRILLSSSSPAVDQFLGDLEEVAAAFVDRAREFDPNIHRGEIRQALRNLWVFNSIQRFQGIKPCLTPSAFAYSLLYPYTDNRIDDECGSADEQRAFLCWLNRRLQGLDPGPDSPLHVARLLDMIESEYPRHSFVHVHESLLGIHRAQQKNLSLRARSSAVTSNDLMISTMEKGGTSVLVDGYLVHGELNEESTKAIYAYGVLLQLIDDLEDLHEDMEAQRPTPFSLAMHCGPMDSTIDRMIGLSARVFDSLASVMTGCTGDEWQMFERTCRLSILAAVASQEEIVSKEYFNLVKSCLPVGVQYLKQARNRISSMPY
jgi:hypothetical protein